MKNITFRDVDIKDKEFILEAHEEINNLSGINNDSFKERIDKDLFEEKFCKSIVAEIDGNIVWMILYCYIYWVNFWRWIYISQVYVKKEYRGQWIYKQLIEELKNKENWCNFFTDLVWLENLKMKNILEKMNFKSSNLVTYYKKL